MLKVREHFVFRSPSAYSKQTHPSRPVIGLLAVNVTSSSGTTAVRPDIDMRMDGVRMPTSLPLCEGVFSGEAHVYY